MTISEILLFVENVNACVFKTRTKKQCMIRWSLIRSRNVFLAIAHAEMWTYFRIKSYLERQERWFLHPLKLFGLPFILGWQITEVLHLLVMWGKTVIWKYRIYKVLFIAVSKLGIYLPVFLVLYFLRVTFSCFSISIWWKEIISKMADAVVWWTHRLSDKYGMNRSAASVSLDREKRYFTFLIEFFWVGNKIWSDKNKH